MIYMGTEIHWDKTLNVLLNGIKTNQKQAKSIFSD